MSNIYPSMVRNTEEEDDDEEEKKPITKMKKIK